MNRVRFPKYWLAGAAIIVAGVAAWLLTTDNLYVWPVRNTLQYHLLVWLTGPLTEPPAGPTGTLRGAVYNEQGQPLAGAGVLVAYRNGVTFKTRTNAVGSYAIDNIPPGWYRPVAGAPGYHSLQFGNWAGLVSISANAVTTATAVLTANPPQKVAPGTAFRLSDETTITCNKPLASQVNCWQVFFNNADGQPNQPTFYYTPLTATVAGKLPLLLAIYPGPADSWECASAPLAAAGYAVLATGPAYTFNLEADLDELERSLAFARQGQLPGTIGQPLALLGGSYSSLHVQRLLQRGQPNVAGALLLGPPTDLFEMRHQLEKGTYIPPFGLDKAFIALGLPGSEPLRYWDYSGAYHVRADFPPLAILHSRTDEVVPYQQSQLLAQNLEQVGAPYELHFFDGASHYLMAEGGDADTQKIFGIAIDFLARRLH